MTHLQLYETPKLGVHQTGSSSIGPSLGSINRSVLLACDYFVSPMTIDIFSLKAVENISTSIENWKKATSDSARKLAGSRRTTGRS
jgi:cellulose biosynthesis protein BcsQ